MSNKKNKIIIHCKISVFRYISQLQEKYVLDPESIREVREKNDYEKGIIHPAILMIVNDQRTELGLQPLPPIEIKKQRSFARDDEE